MFRSLFVIFYLMLFLLLHIPHLFFYIPLLQPKDRRNYIHQKGRKLSHFILKCLRITYEVEGLERLPNHTPVLYTPNHQGYFDIPMLFAAIPHTKAFVSKIEIKKIPLVSQWMKQLGCVFLDRQSPKSARSSVDASIQRLKNGLSIVIFPEGTTSEKKEMHVFKPGSFKIGQHAQVPIVPVVIEGTYHIFTRKSFRFHPTHLKICILDAIPVKEHIQMDTIDVADMVQHRIQEKLNTM